MNLLRRELARDELRKQRNEFFTLRIYSVCKSDDQFSREWWLDLRVVYWIFYFSDLTEYIFYVVVWKFYFFFQFQRTMFRIITQFRHDLRKKDRFFDFFSQSETFLFYNDSEIFVVDSNFCQIIVQKIDSFQYFEAI